MWRWPRAFYEYCLWELTTKSVVLEERKGVDPRVTPPHLFWSVSQNPAYHFAKQQKHNNFFFVQKDGKYIRERRGKLAGGMVWHKETNSRRKTSSKERLKQSCEYAQLGHHPWLCQPSLHHQPWQFQFGSLWLFKHCSWS